MRIDGVSRGVIDTYSPSDNVLSVVYPDLGPGTHTLTLTVLNQKHSSASDTRVHLDYIDVWDGTALPDGTFEHDDPRLIPSSNWTVATQTQARSGSYLQGGSNLWVPFSGDGLTYQAWVTSNGGTVDLLVDGQLRQTVSLQRSTARLEAWTLTGLGNGPHVLQIRTASGTATMDTVTVPGHLPGAAPTGLARSEC
ncbi:hypothetical protein HC891_12200 [Candidatus Gracilibacteria bacterium]|nr:hypothetical protein [Candidatus Gracilibacteria bacterium]